MSGLNWGCLLPSRELICSMQPDQLDNLRLVSDSHMHNLAHGISGVGSLLAGAAGNSDAGMNADALADVGWLLQSLGGLISKLSDTTAHADDQIDALKRTEPPRRK